MNRLKTAFLKNCNLKKHRKMLIQIAGNEMLF